MEGALMTKKQQQPATVDDEREPKEFEVLPPPSFTMSATSTDEQAKQLLLILPQLPPALAALIDSGVVTYDDGIVTFRAGHLEHLALEYVRDPVGTWRDYHDDVEVAQTYCLEQWDKLINGELH